MMPGTSMGQFLLIALAKLSTLLFEAAKSLSALTEAH
jgi:hypothetical protein